MSAALVGASAATTVALAHAAVTEAGRLWRHRDALAFDDLVLGCALAVLAAAAGWLCLGVLLTVATTALHAGHGCAAGLARRMTPAVCRRLLGSACGVAVLAASTAAAPAAGAPPEQGERRAPGCAARFCATGLAGLPLPDRPVSTRAGASPGLGRATVRVAPGDTLWAIAARHLPAGTTDAEIAAAWPRWFRANRVRIGPDPHLIHPGTRLRVPPRPTAPTRTTR